jgi:hypothetical protein
MNVMRRLIAPTVAAMLVAGCTTSPSAVNVCTMQAPPADAKVRSTHAGKLLTYPPSIDAQYTGCRVTWLENGQRLATVRLEGGAVRSVEINEPDKPAKRCEFDPQGRLTRGDAAECLPREDWVR